LSLGERSVAVAVVVKIEVLVVVGSGGELAMA
jgi:hypothetical protein